MVLDVLPQSPDVKRRHTLKCRAAARVQYREHNLVTTQLFVVLQAVTRDCPGFDVARNGPVLHSGIVQLVSKADEPRAREVIMDRVENMASPRTPDVMNAFHYLCDTPVASCCSGGDDHWQGHETSYCVRPSAVPLMLTITPVHVEVLR